MIGSVSIVDKGANPKAGRTGDSIGGGWIGDTFSAAIVERAKVGGWMDGGDIGRTCSVEMVDMVRGGLYHLGLSNRL